MTAEELIGFLKHSGEIAEFRPYARHNKFGNHVECYWEEPDYSEQINSHICVHKLFDGRIVGVTIGGVKQMLNGETVPPREV